MSKFRLRRLEHHKIGGTGDEMRLAIPLPQSASGKVHRCCPVPECVPNLFQLGEAPSGRPIAEEYTDRVHRRPGDPGMTCPYCGHDAPDEEFTFRGDIQAAREYVEWAFAQDTADQLDRIAQDFNRQMKRARGIPFGITMDVKRPPLSRPFVWREDLLRDLTCDVCGRRYGVYAIALFCPDCGARNLHVHFRREIELIGQQLDIAKKVQGDLSQELAYRLLGNAHEDVLTAFETYLKTIYRFLVKRRLADRAKELCAKRAIGNRFQNIQRGRKLFADIRIDPYVHLAEADLNFLRLNIEKRHVLGHNLSMADDAYEEAAHTEQPGQTVRLLAEEVSRFAEICGDVVLRLEEGAPEFGPARTDVVPPKVT